ncbi:MAG TPA: nuclear transport factor 2 family protein [Acidimicrobiales bacterium]|jgi:ketosteroid isomerase-like protein|nr:nuclear transport factor 2 family protein [Acidimicrobiales bacterium]
MANSDEIAALVHSYALLLDGGDTEAVVALFEHATLRSEPNGSLLRGSDEIRPIYERLKGEGAPRTKHLLTNLTIDVGAEATTATSHCYWTVLREVPTGGIDVMLSGHYVDTFEKVEGRWRFADRLITVDLGGTAETTGGEPTPSA